LSIRLGTLLAQKIHRPPALIARGSDHWASTSKLGPERFSNAQRDTLIVHIEHVSEYAQRAEPGGWFPGSLDF
jgi:hypothetical protein